MHWKKAFAACFGLTVAAVTAGTSLAGMSDREAAMKHIVHSLRAVYQMVQTNSFNADTANQRGTEIATYLQQFEALFPAGTEQADLKAGSRIWSDRAGFEAAVNESVGAARGLAKVSDPPALQDALKRLGATCKNCHDNYAVLR